MDVENNIGGSEKFRLYTSVILVGQFEKKSRNLEMAKWPF